MCLCCRSQWLQGYFSGNFVECSQHLISRATVNGFLKALEQLCLSSFVFLLEAFFFLFEAISFVICQKLIFENNTFKNNQFSCNNYHGDRSSVKWSDPGHFLESQGKFFLSFPCTLFLHIFDT